MLPVAKALVSLAVAGSAVPKSIEGGFVALGPMKSLLSTHGENSPKVVPLGYLAFGPGKAIETLAESPL
jgi:hypothetical protein